MANPKKSHALQLFAKLVRYTRKEFEKSGNPIPYREAQKWVSANLYPLFKGQHPRNVKVKDIVKAVKQIQSPKKKKQICGDVFAVSIADLDLISWWEIEEALLSIDPLVQVRLNTQGMLSSTGVMRAADILAENETKDLVGQVRELEKNLSGKQWAAVRKVVPNGSDDGNPCSYFIDLILTDDAGNVDTEGEVLGQEIPLSDEEVERKKARSKEVQRLLKERRKKSKAKERKRPAQKTAKISRPEDEKAESAKPKGEAQRISALNKTLELLRKDFDDGIITKDEYRKDRAQIMSKFEKGGEI